MSEETKWSRLVHVGGRISVETDGVVGKFVAQVEPEKASAICKAVYEIVSLSPRAIENAETGNEQLARELAERLQLLYGYQVGLNDLVPAIMDLLGDWQIPRASRPIVATNQET